jgi:hypothetical protein
LLFHPPQLALHLGRHDVPAPRVVEDGIDDAAGGSVDAHFKPSPPVFMGDADQRLEDGRLCPVIDSRPARRIQAQACLHAQRRGERDEHPL